MTYFDFTDFNKLEPIKFFSTTPTFTASNTMFGSTKITNGMKESPTYHQAPGFTKNDISAEIKHGDLLHIKGESSKYGERVLDVVFIIPELVDHSTIDVAINDGMITITFEEKKEETRKIKVK